MKDDLRRASFLALALVLLLLLAVSRQIAAPIILAIPLGLGIAATLAITARTIGQLNIVSGFLVTALIGIGIDYGIHLYLRFLEYLPGRTRSDAMLRAIQASFGACLTSGLTTAAAFLAMLYSDFRGFKEYGQIASIGVLVSLLFTFVSLPPLAMFLTIRRRKHEGDRRAPGHGAARLFRTPFVWLMLFFGLALTVYSALKGPDVEYYNDFKKRLRGYSPAVEFAEYVERSLGGSLAPAAIAVRSIAEARQVEQVAKKRVADPNIRV